MKRKILIITEEEQNLNISSILIQQRNYEVIRINPLSENPNGIKLFKPDIILLDIPKTDSFSFKLALSIKEDIDLNRIPLILLINSADKMKAINSKADGYIEKPVNRDIFAWQIEYLAKLSKTETISI